jgi:hypothetical protein
VGYQELAPLSRDLDTRACAALGACLELAGLGACVEMLDQSRRWNPANQSVFMAFYAPPEWTRLMALVQNTACVAAATTCDEVLACLNGGKLERHALPDRQALLGRSCQDDDTLLDHWPAAWPERGIQTRVSCHQLGLRCITVRAFQASDDRTVSLCANGTSTETDWQLRVTCDGSLASLAGFGVELRLDCASLGLTCQVPAGQDFDRITFCGSGGPTCDPQTFPAGCQGDRAVTCEGGWVISRDCGQRHQTCGLVQIGDWLDQPVCVTDACSPSLFAERCEPDEGMITYCGTGGVRRLDCRALGFPACVLVNNRARCVE